jgi:hypothetical protein
LAFAKVFQEFKVWAEFVTSKSLKSDLKITYYKREASDDHFNWLFVEIRLEVGHKTGFNPKAFFSVLKNSNICFKTIQIYEKLT